MTWFELGAVRYNQRQWADASNWIERAYLCDTNNAEAVLYLSRSLAEQGQLEKASLVIQHHIKRKRGPTALLVQLGFVRLLNQEIASALEVLEEARDSDGATLEILIGIGQCHYQMSRGDLAIEAFSKAIEIDPNHQKTRVALAQCLVDKGALAAARHHCLAVDPKSAEISRARAILAAIDRVESDGNRRPVAKWPRARELFDDPRQLARDFILAEIDKNAIHLGPNTKLVTLGSCFAENLARELSVLGVETQHIGFAEILNSTYANRYFLDWLYEAGEVPELYPSFSRYFAKLDKDATRAVFDGADLFVYTLGVAPCLFEAISGKFVFNADSSEIGMHGLSSRYQFRTTTVEENFQNMQSVASILLARKPNARLVYTVSPVPLNATFEYKSAIIADSVSNSILRAAADQLARAADPRLVYWPSFETVRWFGAQ
jgi:tetratricopeptide (TPR) repeat protein